MSLRRKAVQTLREAAEMLRQNGGMVSMPGWDDAAVKFNPHCEARRKAALAAAGTMCGPDDSVQVPPEDLAALVQYVADMLED